MNRCSSEEYWRIEQEVVVNDVVIQGRLQSILLQFHHKCFVQLILALVNALLESLEVCLDKGERKIKLEVVLQDREHVELQVDRLLVKPIFDLIELLAE